MKKDFIRKRQYYFGFLFFSFIYFGVAMLLVKNVKPADFGLVQQGVMIIGAFIPALMFFLRNKMVTIKKYLLLLLLGQIPMVVGFVLTIFYKNFLYLLIMFPVFVLGYLIIIPIERK